MKKTAAVSIFRVVLFLGFALPLLLPFNAKASICSALDWQCSCSVVGDCNNVKGCIGSDTKEMDCNTDGTSSCPGACVAMLNTISSRDCVLSGDEFRCIDSFTKIAQYSSHCIDCTGCEDYQISFDACPADQACYDNGSTKVCGTLASVTSLLVQTHQGQNFITWDTRSERNNLGFNLYRIDADGDKSRINEKLILGSHSSPVGDRYRFVDQVGKAGDRYQLEWIDHNGPVKEMGPVVAIAGVPQPFAKRFDPIKIRRLAEMKRASLLSYLQGHPRGQVLVNGLLPQKTGLRIKVKQSGWTQMMVEDLAEAGIDLTGLSADSISLQNNGQPVPFRASSTEALTASDTIEFYAQETDSLISGTNVYLLDSASSSTLLADISAAPDSGLAKASAYEAELRFEEDIYYALIPKIDDSFYWSYLYRNNPETSFDVQVDAMAPEATSFRFLADMDGINKTLGIDPDHHYQIFFNDNLVKDCQWDGTTLYHVDETLPIALLQDGKNTITIKQINDTGGEYDMIAIDGFSVVYQRKFIATDDELVFSLAANEENVEISGFTGPNLTVLDISNPNQPVRLTDISVQAIDDTYTVAFGRPATDLPANKYHVLTENKAKSPFEINLRYQTDIKAESNGADLLIITYDAFVSALTPLVELRKQQGLRVALVTTSEIFDEFNYGNLSDLAIKDFITYARTHWQGPALSKVLLVGDSTNDPKDSLGLGLINYLPSHPVETRLWGGTTSDNWYADLDNSGDYELAIGRLPATTVAEAEQMVTKILKYEEANQNALPGANRVIVIADKSTPGRNEHFEELAAEMAIEFPAAYETVVILAKDFANAEDAKHKVITELEKGSLLVVFVGHGSGLSWGDETLFTVEDILNLPVDIHQPMAISLSCVNGYFTYPGLDIMGEAFVKPASQGAIASWMPSDIGLPQEHAKLFKSFARNLLETSDGTIGDSIRQALNELAAWTDSSYAYSIAETFVFMGDPSLRLHTVALEEEPDQDQDPIVNDGASCAGCAVNQSSSSPFLFGLLAFALMMLAIRRRR